MSEAIAALTSDPSKQLMTAVQCVLTATDPDERHDALADVIDFCHEIDLALGKAMDGCCVLASCVGDK